jgi:hypothetical protein
MLLSPIEVSLTYIAPPLPALFSENVQPVTVIVTAEVL